MSTSNPRATRQDGATAWNGQACLLDHSGAIVWVNEVWRRLGTPLGDEADHGTDYLELLESIAGANSIVAQLTNLLAGDGDCFEASHGSAATPNASQPNLLRAEAITLADRRHVLVTHGNTADAARQDSEERYRQFLEAAPDPVFLLGAEGDDLGRILDANTIAAQMHGYERHELIGRSIGDLDAPQDAALVRQRIERLMTDGHIGFEVTHVHRDGHEFPIEVSARTAKISGRPCIVSFNRDLTERRRVEKELQEQKVRLDLAISASQIGFWDWDLVADTVYYSAEWKAQIGYAADEIGNQFDEWEKRVHPDDLPGALAAIQYNLEGSTPNYVAEFRLRHRDGSYRWIMVRGETVRDDDHRPIRMVGCHIDITQQKEAEQERAAMTQRLGQLQRLEAMGTLAGGIAHDFNNILSIISGNVELALLQRGDDTDDHELLLDIRRAGERAQSLVRQILAFSRDETPQRRRVPVRQIIDEAVRLLNATTPRAITIAHSVSDGVPDIHADPDQLHQVLINLGTNAWHAIGNGTGRIELKATRAQPMDGSQGNEDDEGVIIEIVDDGAGMTADVQERIFEPFFTTKSSGQGTGLGLSVVHGIVNNHDGSIEVLSKPGAGTTFRIRLPAAAEQDDAPELRTGEEHSPARVLLLDDEPHLLRTLARGLEHRGHVVTSFTEPQLALAALDQDDDFDVLVTDYDMPTMQGIEVAAAAHHRRPDLPIVLCSGFLRPEAFEKATAAGVSQVLGKPVLASQLSGAVAELLGKTRNPMDASVKPTDQAQTTER